jgi:hypothetical protein
MMDKLEAINVRYARWRNAWIDTSPNDMPEQLKTIGELIDMVNAVKDDRDLYRELFYVKVSVSDRVETQMEHYNILAQAVILCDSTDPNNPVMDGNLYREAMAIITAEEIDKQNWDNCSIQDIADAWDVSIEQVKMDLLSGRKLPDNIRGLALNDNETIIFQKRVDDDLKGQEDEFISNNNP